MVEVIKFGKIYAEDLALGDGTDTVALVDGSSASLSRINQDTFSKGVSGSIVNVLDKKYGATGNGTTNDTAAIAAAMVDATGGALYLPRPTVSYKVTTGLVPVGPMLICGDGYASYIAGAVTGPVFALASASNNVTFRDLRVSNGHATTADNAIRGIGCTDLHLERVWMSGAHSALVFRHVHRAWIRDCVWNGCYHRAISIDGQDILGNYSSEIWIIDPYISGTVKNAAVDASAPHNLEVIDTNNFHLVRPRIYDLDTYDAATDASIVLGITQEAALTGWWIEGGRLVKTTQGTHPGIDFRAQPITGGVHTVSDVHVTETILENYLYGILMDVRQDYSYSEATFKNITIKNSSTHGMRITRAGAATGIVPVRSVVLDNVNVIGAGAGVATGTNGIEVTLVDGVTVRGGSGSNHYQRGLWGQAASNLHIDGFNGSNNNQSETAGLGGIAIAINGSNVPTGTTIKHCECSDTQASATQDYGITVGNTVIDIVVESNHCVGNVTSGVYPGTLAAGKILRNNVGYNPIGGFSAPALPGTGVAFVNPFGVDAMVYVSGGTVTQIQVGGTALTGITSGPIRVTAGQSITMTYSSNPTWVWIGS